MGLRAGEKLGHERQCLGLVMATRQPYRLLGCELGQGRPGQIKVLPIELPVAHQADDIAQKNNGIT